MNRLLEKIREALDIKCDIDDEALLQACEGTLTMAMCKFQLALEDIKLASVKDFANDVLMIREKLNARKQRLLHTRISPTYKDDPFKDRTTPCVKVEIDNGTTYAELNILLTYALGALPVNELTTPISILVDEFLDGTDSNDAAFPDLVPGDHYLYVTVES